MCFLYYVERRFKSLHLLAVINDCLYMHEHGEVCKWDIELRRIKKRRLKNE